MNEGRMLCNKEFNHAQKVWALSLADNLIWGGDWPHQKDQHDLGWGSGSHSIS